MITKNNNGKRKWNKMGIYEFYKLNKINWVGGRIS